MILLDSDHITVLKYPGSERAAQLAARLSASGDAVQTTVITIEEQMRGWMAAQSVRVFRVLHNRAV